MITGDDVRTVLAVDLDYFYAQCEEVRKPDLKDRPVVVCVYSGRTEDSGAVSTCNYIARGLGVKSGIPIVIAKRILSKHSDAVFLAIDKEFYDSVSERIMEILHSYTTKMEQVSVDEAYLDVTERTRNDFSLAKKMGMEIKNEILASERLTCSVGIGPNKLIAKMAVDMKKPDGLTLVLPEQVHSFLDPIPVGKLFGIGPKTEKKLGTLNVKSIGDLAKCDEEKLSNEFGRNLGPQLKRLAQGIDNDLVQEREAEQLSRIITLKHDAEKFDFYDEMRPLCQNISQRLKARGLLCRSVSVIAITKELKLKTRARSLKVATNSESRIYNEIVELFDSFFRENQVQVRRAGIRVTGLEKTNESNEDSSLNEFLG